MTSTVAVFDTTLQKTNEWVRDVAEELHTDDRQYAYRVVRAVLHGLRDRLPIEEAAHLEAQLPMLLRGAYYEGWSPSPKPTKYNRQEFFEALQNDLSDQPGVPDPDRWTRAVFAVLSKRVDQGEIQDVVGILPEELANLWPESVRS